MEIRREIVLPAPRDEVWEALTQSERLEDWFANEVSWTHARAGRLFRWDNGEEKRAVVESVEPEERLVLRWDDDGEAYPASRGRRRGNAVVVRETSPEGARRCLSTRWSRARPSGTALLRARGPAPALRRRNTGEPRSATATQLAAELPVTRQG